MQIGNNWLKIGKAQGIKDPAIHDKITDNSNVRSNDSRVIWDIYRGPRVLLRGKSTNAYISYQS